MFSDTIEFLWKVKESVGIVVRALTFQTNFFLLCSGGNLLRKKKAAPGCTGLLPVVPQVTGACTHGWE